MMDPLSEKERRLIFINLLVTGIATSMLSTSMTTLIPPLVSSFGITVYDGQWVTSIYSLVSGIMLPFSAFLIKRFRTRGLYIFGLVVFLFGELVSGLSTTFGTMMAGRVLQATGGAVISAMGTVIILSIYPGEKRGQMMGWYGLTTAAAPIVAPTIAGALSDSIGWRSIFFVNMVFVAVSLALALTHMRNCTEQKELPFDFVSFVESMFAFGGLTLGLGNIRRYGLLSLMGGLPLLIGLVAALVFVLRQLKLKVPFLNLRILRHGGYAVSVLGSVILYAPMMASTVVLPILIQSVFGYSATVSGLVTLPGSLACAILSPMTGRLYDRLGIKPVFRVGSCLFLFSFLGMVFLPEKGAVLWVIVLNVIRNLSLGCMMMPLLTWGTSFVEKEYLPDASSLLTSLRTIAGAIGIAVYASGLAGTTIGVADVEWCFALMCIPSLLLLGIAFLAPGLVEKK